MWGILMAGGSGTRLGPLTSAISKHLLAVYDKPLIYYSLSTMLLAGVTRVALVTDPNSESMYRSLFGDGKTWGIEIKYFIQQRAIGIAEGFRLTKSTLSNQNQILLALGDNVFFGSGLGASLAHSFNGLGAKIFATPVSNPSDYGVVEIDIHGHAVSLEEKPELPKSKLAVPGLYFFDGQVFELADRLEPSARGELEITDINRVYLKNGELRVELLPRGTAWMDTGNPEAIAEATALVRSIQNRQASKIGCPEEIVWRMGYIDDNQLAKLAEPLMKSGYGQYLLSLLEQGK